LVSVAADGTQGDATSGAIHHGQAVSDDGRYVVFQSDASTLVADDNDGGTDIFLRDTVAHTTTLISRDASGTPAYGSNPEISGDGRYITFTSDSALVPGDHHNFTDI